ncbi:MAG: carboxypeptidase regulatory-like domain-containing protein [Deltaproteobacteria bacterium]|nr:carboxypeptidase regulatory-like domain-containing protein [Deltaproteobacteria bacterium]
MRNRRAAFAILACTGAISACDSCADGRAGRPPGVARFDRTDADSAGTDGAVAPADGALSESDALILDGDFFFDASIERDSGGSDLGAPDSGDPCGYLTEVIGRVCSPEARDWVAGAQVTLEAIDCLGAPIILSAVTGPDGSFSILGVPPGTWNLTATAGAFSRVYTVTVPASGQVVIPTDQLCVEQDVVRVAVVTGFGDRIETLLSNLGIRYDTFDGAQGWATSAAPFLADLAQLQQYDLVFIDCAAATASYLVDLGPNAPSIVANLRQYVLGGGSLYASDWAVTFLAMAFPSMVQPRLRTTSTVSNPFQATELSGYAPQTITAQVIDAPLASAIGATQVSIAFPDASGARSTNWGLLDLTHTTATVLVEGQALTCSAGATICNQQSTPGPAVTAPLAVRFKLTPQTERGGNVYYTAFHNIAQTGTGVADILRWIVFHL